MSVELPAPLPRPRSHSGRTTTKVMLDLTVYLAGPSLPQFELLLDEYARMAPAGRLQKYRLAGGSSWIPVSSPILGASCRAAARLGRPFPYLEPARERLREGCAFEVGLWDGRSIDDPQGSWSFKCVRLQVSSRGWFSFARILVPRETDPAILMHAASTLAQHVEFLSGHGGWVFAYDPRFKRDAMDEIYAGARRFWGIDVEDLSVTLPLTRRGIKGVNWLTLVGKPFYTPALSEGVRRSTGIVCQYRRHGLVFQAGAEPVAGDRHRPDGSLEAHFELARVLAPAYLDVHPDFTGARFIEHGNTLGWLRRFLEPGGWA